MACCQHINSLTAVLIINRCPQPVLGHHPTLVYVTCLSESSRHIVNAEFLARMRTSNPRLTPVQLQQPQSHRDYDSVNFTSRKDYESLKFSRPPLPPQVAPKPRLSSVDEASSDQPQLRRAPPPQSPADDPELLAVLQGLRL